MFGNPFYFSTFAAFSELVVTAIVLQVIISNMRGEPLRWKLLFGTLAYELLVNITYMVERTVVVTTNHPDPLGNWVGILGAVHGILSLIMFVGLVVISMMAFRASRKNVAFFQNYKGLTLFFVVFWLISIISGEVLYFAVWQPF